MGRWATQKTLNLTVQAGQLRTYFPDSQATVRRSCLTWRGRITPSPLSRTYLLRVDYKLNERPDVEVVEPALESRDGTKPPHLFPGDKLCLCLNGEWNGTMLLATTLLPWAAEWLLHYEIWLATGEWCGGGVHPDVSPQRKAEAQPRSAPEGYRGDRLHEARRRPR
jgi:hypothetical protein